MTNPALGLIVTLTAPDGRGEDLAAFLRDAVPDAIDEVGTLTWLVVRSDATTFHIIDTFPDEAARTAHVEGVIARGMRERGADLFASRPVVTPTEVVAMMPSKGTWRLPIG